MRNLILTFSFLTASLMLLTFFVGVTPPTKIAKLPTPHPHLYGDENIPLDTISLTVFYFIPKDAVAKKRDDWKEVTEKHLKKLSDFHAVQFKNTSKIIYTFSPEIIIGEKTTKDYESLFTYDDHDAIIPVKEEIMRRVLNPRGNLYTKEAGVQKSGTRKVYLVIFEGNGAAGNGDFALISRSYLTDEAYKEEGTTFLAHEFYHTLGLPDKYKTSAYVYKDMEQTLVSLISNKDIMGQVNIPISSTYIDVDTLKKMGL